MNPTGSFKDRYVAVTMDRARACGAKGIVVSSTGNLGVSAAAYAAAAGLPCLLLVPTNTRAAMLSAARAFGASVVHVPSELRMELMEHVATRPGWFPVSLFMPRRISNPYGIEGYRSIAYEILEDLDQSPDVVVYPCARGNGLYGTWKGFQDALAWGWMDARPRMVACQPEQANSLECAIRDNSSLPVRTRPVPSVAFSVNEDVSLPHALGALRASSGTAVSAGDEAILRATRELAQTEGILAESSSAIAIACLESILATLKLASDASVVCVLTASGERSRDLLFEGSAAPPPMVRYPGELDGIADSLIYESR